ncbi:MAG: hypothetical protein AB1422_00955 [bacterium]
MRGIKITILILLIISLGGKESFAWKLGFDPFATEIKGSPGTSRTFEINIFISDKKEAKVKIYPTDITIERNGEFRYPPAGMSKYSCAKWIKLQPEGEMIIKEDEKKKILCKVTIPRGTPIGERYAAIMCETLPEKTAKGGITAHYRIASIVYLTVGIRGFTEKINILNTDMTKEKENTIFTITVENKGNIRLVPDKGILYIKSGRGRIITQTPITADTYTMFPEDIRDFKAVINQKLPDGNYTAEIKIPYGQEKYGRKKILMSKTPVMVKNGVLAKGVGEEKSEEYLSFYTLPTAANEKVMPQGFRSRVIQLFNTENIPIDIRVELRDAFIDEKGRIIYLEPGTTSYSCVNCLKVNPSSFTIPANEQKVVKYNISVPKEERGGKYGAILFIASSGDKRGEAIVPIGIIIPNTLQENLILNDLKILPNLKELKVSFNLTNAGNVSLQPTGKVVVQERHGEKVAEILLPEGILILPQGTHKIDLLQPHNLEPGEYIAIFEISYGEKKSIEEKRSFLIKR